MGRDEIRGIMCTRNHMSGRDNRLHEVVEFSFLRLRRAGEYLLPLSTLLLVLQGYLRVYEVTAGTIDTQAALVQWAVEPRKVAPQSLDVFCENIHAGLREINAGHDIEGCMAALRRALEIRQGMLPD